MRITAHDDLQIAFNKFQGLGILYGGLFPILVLSFMELTWGIEDVFLSRNMSFLILALIVFTLVLTIGMLYLKGNSKWAYSRKFSFLSISQPISCAVLVHFLISVTGGSKNSAFASFYLYTLSILALAYGRRWSFWLMAIVFVVSFFINLYYPWTLPFPRDPSVGRVHHLYEPYFSENYRPFRVETVYLIVFFIQLSALFFTSPESMHNRRSNG